MEIVPLAFDSFGVRSMSTFVETKDVRILIDPGVSLGPRRYGLPPHELEWRRLEELAEVVAEKAEEADVLIVTHYHYDHHDTGDLIPVHVYEGKHVFIKHPKEKINVSQRVFRAPRFLEAIGDLPESLDYADGREFKLGSTKIKFSPAVCHGTNPRLGYVVEVSIECGGEKFLFTSDVEGPALDEQVDFILKEKPGILFVDGPMTYMLGYRYSQASLEASVRNLVRVVGETDVQTIVIDHHFLRDLNYLDRIAPLLAFADSKGVNVVTAAEFASRPIEMLEARRKELFEKYPATRRTFRRELGE